MKSFMKLFVVAVVLMLGIAAVAGDFSQIRISTDVTVAGTKLAAGDYKVKVDGTGPDVKVTFAQNGKVKATVNGTFQEEKKAQQYSSVTLEGTSDGQKLSELRLAKTKGYVKF
ncbi:MAG TPA: hypothetical protein VFU86_06125 [Terriglobales bacterium]|nr:hypothetical protein [Terriglobales bacterium]